MHFRITFLVLLLALLGCDKIEKEHKYKVPNRPNNLLYINLDIKDLPQLQKVALYRLDPVTQAPLLVTRRNVMDGKTSFPVTVDTPTFYLIFLATGQQIPVLLNKSDITVRADFNQFALTLTQTGCRDTELLVRLQGVKRRLSRERGQLSAAKYAQKREDAIKLFLEDAMPSLIGITAVSSLPLEEYGSEYDRVIRELKREYPKSVYVTAFEKSIELQESQTVGAKLRDVPLPIFEGDTIKLSDLRGKYVLLDFWQTAFPNIQKDNQVLKNVYAAFKNDLEIVSVSLDPTPEMWREAIKPLPWKHIYDVVPKKRYSPIATHYGYPTTNLPITFLLDREGKIVDIGIRGAELGQKMRKLLQEES
ncbi:MAG: TlpA disulfide reductase family protein [Bacteroidota bacterium]